MIGRIGGNSEERGERKSFERSTAAGSRKQGSVPENGLLLQPDSRRRLPYRPAIEQEAQREYGGNVGATPVQITAPRTSE